MAGAAVTDDGLILPPVQVNAELVVVPAATVAIPIVRVVTDYDVECLKIILNEHQHSYLRHANVKLEDVVHGLSQEMRYTQALLAPHGTFLNDMRYSLKILTSCTVF